MYLENINSPKDIKNLNIDELNILAKEIRKVLLKKLSIHGGHVGPNLGDVEMTIALHYVFNSPIDKFVFDVSHQSYTHKILTGRKSSFINEEDYDKVTGFSSPLESEHDLFTIGHTSTSISLASGLVKARNQLGGKENIVAIIGDGSLSGGEAFEGFDYAGEMGSNFIVVVNDNEMSIAENHGGLYKNLKDLRESNGTCENNYFKSLGWDYIYVEKGNDIESLIDAFKKVKDIDHPIVVHIHTIKGYGYKYAEENKERFHWSFPFDINTGKISIDLPKESYGELTYDYLSKKVSEDKRIVILNSAVPSVINAYPDRRKELGSQFVDDDIAEENATAMASGIVKRGGIAIYPTCASFMQRTYDQISQDVCINDNQVTFLVFGSSIFGNSDVTHLGTFDIPFIINIPNMIYLAPYSKEEYLAMLEYAVYHKKHPLAIRVPAKLISTGIKDTTDYSIENKSKVVHQGTKVAIIAVGNMMEIALKVYDHFKEKGIDLTIINPIFLTGLDQSLLESLKKDHQYVITLEDSQIDGGYGEKIARFYSMSDVKVSVHGIEKKFIDGYNIEQELIKNKLDTNSIINEINHIIK